MKRNFIICGYKSPHLWGVKTFALVGLLCVFFTANSAVAQNVLKEQTISLCRSNSIPVSLNNAIGVSIPAGAGSWYNEATGKKVNNIVVPDATQNSSYYFVVESKVALCDLQVGDRFNVHIEMQDIATPVGETEQSFCYSATAPLTIADLSVTGNNVAWYDAAVSGNQLALATEIQDGVTYYATQIAKGCGESTNRLPVKVTLKSTCSFEIAPEITDVMCYGDNTGAISVEVIDNGSGTEFTYLWSNGSTSASITNLVAGIYSVTVTPNNGNSPVTEQFEVLQPSKLEVTINVTQSAKGVDATGGELQVVVTGGTASYTYQWNDANQSTSDKISNLKPGIYEVIVTDENGCQISERATIEANLFIPEGFSPNGDGKNEYFKISGLEDYPEAKLEVYNRWNSLVYSKENYGNEARWGADNAWWNGKSNGKWGVGSGMLPADNYIYILRLAPGKVYKGTVFINW